MQFSFVSIFSRYFPLKKNTLGRSHYFYWWSMFRIFLSVSVLLIQLVLCNVILYKWDFRRVVRGVLDSRCGIQRWFDLRTRKCSSNMGLVPNRSNSSLKLNNGLEVFILTVGQPNTGWLIVYVCLLVSGYEVRSWSSWVLVTELILRPLLSN